MHLVKLTVRTHVPTRVWAVVMGHVRPNATGIVSVLVRDVKIPV